MAKRKSYYKRKYKSSYTGFRHTIARGKGKREDTEQYKKFRKEVRRRDKTCKMPGCKCRTKLQVHHIIMWSISPHLRFERTNGILLCKKCHESIRNHEALYITLFHKIVQKAEEELAKKPKRKPRKKKENDNNP